MIKCMFYDKRYSQKPKGYEIGCVQKALKATAIDIKTLAEGMSNGCTFKPAYLNGTTSNDFISQEIFALDFDDGFTIDEALSRCRQKNLKPAFGYTTFSHKPDHQKFRLIFHSSEVITDRQKRDQIQIALMSIFPECDNVCKDPTRLFFGGKGLICIDENAVFDPDVLIEKYYRHSEMKTSTSKKALNTSSKEKLIKNSSTSYQEKVDAISRLDVKAMKALLGLCDDNKADEPIQKKNSNIIIKPINFNEIKKSVRIDLDLNVTQDNIKRRIEVKPFISNFNGYLINQDSADNNNEFDDDCEDCNDIESEDEVDEENKELSAFDMIIIILLISAIITAVKHKLKNSKEVLGGGDNKESYSITPYKNPHVIKPDIKVDDDNANKELPPKQIFKCRNDLYEYITHEIDLTEYLGIDDRKVCCILPEHEDNTPSAHIYTNENGMQFYKCFGCGKSRNIIGITEHLSGCKRSEAIEFIKSVYNLELVESEWTQQQKQLMLDYANYLDTDEFRDEFPDLYKLIRTRKSHIKLMLLHFSNMVNENMQINGKPFFFSSYPKLMEACNIKKSDKLAQSLTLFALLHMIEKLPEDKIPKDDYRKAKAIAAKYNLKKITGFYAFEEYGLNTFNDSEEKAIMLKDNNISLKGLSREWVYRTFGEDEANRVYPQYKYENSKGTSERSDKHTIEIVECIMYCIEKKGYATERDVVSILGEKYNYITTEIQIKKSLQEILNSYSLCRIRVNKEYKERYKIKGNGYPFIIIREEEKI